jgi:hypothetical protein
MVFWFFNALNKNYTTSVSFPLSFEYDRDSYVSVRPLPAIVRINVPGIGWNLFRRSAGIRVPPLVIPLERPGDVNKIVGSTLPAFFANQLAEFQINFVITDTLHVAIEPKLTRRFGVKVPVPTHFFQNGYVMTSDVNVSPDSITLVGPQNLVSGLEDPLTLQLIQRSIDEDYEELVDVKFLNDELIQRQPASVTVSFRVDRLVEVSDSATLEFVNAPRDVRAIERTKKIPCKVAIPERLLPDFVRDSLKAVVDLSEFTRGEAAVVPQIVGLPPYAKTIAVDTIRIKF